MWMGPSTICETGTSKMWIVRNMLDWMGDAVETFPGIRNGKKQRKAPQGIWHRRDLIKTLQPQGKQKENVENFANKNPSKIGQNNFDVPLIYTDDVKYDDRRGKLRNNIQNSNSEQTSGTFQKSQVKKLLFQKNEQLGPSLVPAAATHSCYFRDFERKCRNLREAPANTIIPTFTIT